MENSEEQREAFKNYLIENRDNLVTIRKTEHSYITFNKAKVQEIEIVNRENRDCVRLWLTNGSYEDFPDHSKEEMERVVLS